MTHTIQFLTCGCAFYAPERPIMYSGASGTSWGHLKLPHQVEMEISCFLIVSMHTFHTLFLSSIIFMLIDGLHCWITASNSQCWVQCNVTLWWSQLIRWSFVIISKFQNYGYVVCEQKYMLAFASTAIFTVLRT